MKAQTFLLFLLLVGFVPALAQEAGDDYFVEALVDNPTPFVGQQVTYTVRFYHAIDAENLLFQASDFEGFSRAGTDVSAQGSLSFNRNSPAVVNGRQYQVSELDIVLFPLRVDELEIAPSVLVLGETVFRDEQRLTTNPVTVHVQPLPEDAPEGFNGAVGRFEMIAVLDHASLTLGEPITLRITVTGSGNFEQLAPPTLPLPEGWRVYENPTSTSTGVTGGLLVGDKSFEWLVVPGQTGSQTLPEVTLTFFDPESLGYRSVNTSPVTLEVFPPEEGAAPSAFDESAFRDRPSTLPLKAVPAVLQAIDPYPSALFWLLWLAPPGLAAVCWWWSAQQRRKQRDHLKIRQSKALRRAQEYLQLAQQLPSNAACHRISEAVFIYFGDKLNREAAGLTQADLRQTMELRHVEHALQDGVIACLESADEGRFAPADSINASSLLKRTLETLASVDAVWKTE